MAVFRVSAESLRQKAQEIENAAATFDETTNRLNTAAQALADSWEGDAQKKFAEEQGRRVKWFAQMSEHAKAVARTLRQIAAKYDEAEAEASGAI